MAPPWMVHPVRLDYGDRFASLNVGTGRPMAPAAGGGAAGRRFAGWRFKGQWSLRWATDIRATGSTEPSDSLYRCID